MPGTQVAQGLKHYCPGGRGDHSLKQLPGIFLANTNVVQGLMHYCRCPGLFSIEKLPSMGGGGGFIFKLNIRTGVPSNTTLW